MISLRQIRYFIGVAEAGKVSAAANELNVSQSAITLAIQDLEAEIGVHLFVRRSTGLELTREGHRFLHHAQTINGAVADAMTSMRREVSEVNGRIRLGLTHTLSGYFIFPALARFRRSHPAVDIDFVEDERSALESMLKAGALDLCLLLTSNLSDRRRIVHNTLVQSPRRLWLSSAHPLLARDRITMADIAVEPYVLFHADEADESARRYWAKAKADPNVVFRTTSLEAVRSMVAAGLAVTILSDTVYRPWSLEGSRVEARDIEASIPTMDLGIAWKRGHTFTPVERLFCDHMSEYARSEQRRHIGRSR
jgi:DNA-binding transcriptional LysR family regulator